MKFLRFFSVFVTLHSFGQAGEPKSIDYSKSDFHTPMKIELILAGNFGEMRANHFHTGLDIKTNGAEGQPLYAIDEGYVSRIRISPWGYGLAVYINHPNGLTSLYAHMKSFSTQIDSLAYEKQKKYETFILDEDVLGDSIYVKKGQLIGLSGNSGSSSAPHLHFEIRETATEHAINPLLFSYFRNKIKDTTVPTISGIKLYAVTEKGYMIPGKSIYYSCKLVNNKLVVNEGNPIDVNPLLTENSYLAFGFQTTDRLDGAGNVCGIHHTTFSRDEQLLHEMQIDYIDFEHNRFLNTHQDYFEFDHNKKDIHKHFKTVVNPLAIYLKNNGLISWENCAGNYQLSAKDVHGNETVLSFSLAKASSSFSPNPFDQSADYYFPDSVNIMLREEFQVLMESGTFYEPLQKIFKRDTASTYLSPLYQFGEYAVPVQKKFDVRIKVPDLRADFPFYKLAIGLINDKNKLSYIGGDYVNGWVEAAPRNFGKFVLVVDTVPPKITPLDFTEGKIISKFNNLQLEIADNLSGVHSYKAYLNGKWVLMEYDRKKGRYIIPLNARSKPILRSGNNKLRITARDAKGNEHEMSWNLVY